MARRIDERFVDLATNAVISEHASSTTLTRSGQSQSGRSDTDSNWRCGEADKKLSSGN